MIIVTGAYHSMTLNPFMAAETIMSLMGAISGFPEGTMIWKTSELVFPSVLLAQIVRDKV